MTKKCNAIGNGTKNRAFSLSKQENFAKSGNYWNSNFQEFYRNFDLLVTTSELGKFRFTEILSCSESDF